VRGAQQLGGGRFAGRVGVTLMKQRSGCGTRHFVSRNKISHSSAGGIQVRGNFKRAFVQHVFAGAVEQVVGVRVATLTQLHEHKVDVLRGVDV
jgi:hypothetical protein